LQAYSRLGAAQFALTRYQPAIQTYEKGLKLDSSNAGFIEGIKNAKEAKVKYEAQKKAEAEAKAAAVAAAEKRAQDAAMAKAAAEMVMEEMDEEQSTEDKEAQAELERKEKEAQEKEKEANDLLAGFFDEVSGVTDEQNCTVKSAESKKRAKDYNPGTAEQQIARLLCKGYAFMNLNPYYVLQLDLDADTEDIKQRYRKLSTVVHPDKCRLDTASDAFDQVYSSTTFHSTPPPATTLPSNSSLHPFSPFTPPLLYPTILLPLCLLPVHPLYPIATLPSTHPPLAPHLSHPSHTPPLSHPLSLILLRSRRHTAKFLTSHHAKSCSGS
jgi:tetratricopeptide (TPR) repeat protein